MTSLAGQLLGAGLHSVFVVYSIVVRRACHIFGYSHRAIGSYGGPVCQRAGTGAQVA